MYHAAAAGIVYNLGDGECLLPDRCIFHPLASHTHFNVFVVVVVVVEPYQALSRSICSTRMTSYV